ncbi:hypothetical protein [Trabulsiella guamensis]|uniref:hypothetical protein n=1 Tax=Trabulsiella guamensis TaxID=158852 RepID=UPI0014702618|nr:hypothetical protein [Trabulsiella guamensis]
MGAHSLPMVLMPALLDEWLPGHGAVECLGCIVNSVTGKELPDSIYTGVGSGGSEFIGGFIKDSVISELINIKESEGVASTSELIYIRVMPRLGRAKGKR